MNPSLKKVLEIGRERREKGGRRVAATKKRSLRRKSNSKKCLNVSLKRGGGGSPEGGRFEKRDPLGGELWRKPLVGEKRGSKVGAREAMSALEGKRREGS